MVASVELGNQTLYMLGGPKMRNEDEDRTQGGRRGRRTV